MLGYGTPTLHWVICPHCGKKQARLKYGEGEWKCARCKTVFTYERSLGGKEKITILVA